MIDWNFDMSSAPRDGTWIVILCEESIQNDPSPKPFVTTTRWEEEHTEFWERTSADTKVRRFKDWSHWDCHEDPVAWAPLPLPAEVTAGMIVHRRRAEAAA